MYGNMYIINGNLTLITFCLGNLKKPTHLYYSIFFPHTCKRWNWLLRLLDIDF